MRRISSIIFIILNLFFSVSSFAEDVYKFDPNHTYVLWHASHFGFSSPSGKWLAEGTLTLDEKKPQNSKVDVTIKVGNLVTAIEEFDKHLKGKLFLDIAQFPIATFVSNQVILSGKNSAKVKGTLTLRGISKPVTLDVKLNKKGINPINDKETLGFTAKTTIKRSDFDITTMLPDVSDEVKIDIEAEAFKEAAQ